MVCAPVIHEFVAGSDFLALSEVEGDWRPSGYQPDLQEASRSAAGKKGSGEQAARSGALRCQTSRSSSIAGPDVPRDLSCISLDLPT